jgi:hypothetical protein
MKQKFKLSLGNFLNLFNSVVCIIFQQNHIIS